LNLASRSLSYVCKLSTVADLSL